MVTLFTWLRFLNGFLLTRVMVTVIDMGGGGDLFLYILNVLKLTLFVENRFVVLIAFFCFL